MDRTNQTALILLLWLCAIALGDAFSYPSVPLSNVFTSARRPAWRTVAFRQMSHAPADGDPSEIVAKRILVKGDIGGYYRQCVVNEVRDRLKLGACPRRIGREEGLNSTIILLVNQAGRFRRLLGTMTPPDGSDEAEIYVEGKRKMVDGFIRWCRKGEVGLSQVVKVVDVVEEDPTGLYDGFYAKVREDS
jgi:acylphosphatase